MQSNHPSAVMRAQDTLPRYAAGDVFLAVGSERGVDGRDKPGHDSG
jgi:hypothetical protein